MCDCINEVTKKSREHLSNQPHVSKVNYCVPSYTFATKDTVSRACISVLYSVETVLKNGKTKTVESTSSLVGDFCPFCGERY